MDKPISQSWFLPFKPEFRKGIYEGNIHQLSGKHLGEKKKKTSQIYKQH